MHRQGRPPGRLQGQGRLRELLGDVVRPLQVRDPDLRRAPAAVRRAGPRLPRHLGRRPGRGAASPSSTQYKMNYPVLVGLGRDDVQEAYGPMVGIPVTVVDRPRRQHLHPLLRPAPQGALRSRHQGALLLSRPGSRRPVRGARHVPPRSVGERLVYDRSTMLKGFTHARLACGCRVAFREGVEGSPGHDRRRSEVAGVPPDAARAGLPALRLPRGHASVDAPRSARGRRIRRRRMSSVGHVAERSTGSWVSVSVFWLVQVVGAAGLLRPVRLAPGRPVGGDALRRGPSA